MTGDRLPREVERALARIAEGRGRTLTAAHPACSCAPGVVHIDGEVGTRRHDGYVTPERRRACPVHGRTHPATEGPPDEGPTADAVRA